ncbi:MAG TPA: sigma-70 family RNA polymerase sigma factor [Gemmataceae bacterium]|nr:sigma-70 family RNA polymerase sigma factor [Gemmataceae bacterium]
MGVEESFEDLLERVRRGDEDAATALVRRYEPEVRRFVRYRLNSPRMRRLLDSVDVCQSVFANFFVAVAEGRFDLHNSQQLRHLLMTMAGNKLLDHVRKQGRAKRGGRKAVRSRGASSVIDPAAEPARAAEAQDLIDTVRRRLNDEERDLLDRWMEGCGWPEIASGSGASPEALRKRFTRALDRVAREIGLGDQS